MAHATLVDGNDLNRWSSLRQAQSKLPVIVRRLIRATVAQITSMSFPGDEAVQLGGWDGRLQVVEGNEYVPDGSSVWEFGTNTNVKGKADKDYNKRTQDPGDIDQAKTVYVFVTSRTWGGKDDWIEEKNKEGKWLEVLAYDGEDLSAWLETAPNVHIWTSILTGKKPEDATDLEHFWEEWAEVSSYPFSPELVIASRQSAAQSVRDWISGSARLMALQTETPMEAVAFYAAVVKQLPEAERDAVQSRSVVVQSPSAWGRLLLSETPLILIPTFSERSITPAGVKKGHHVLLPLGLSDSSGSQSVRVERPSRDSIHQALTNMEVPAEQVDELATLGRRSLSALRRRFAPDPSVLEPKWAATTEAFAILPALLVGKWDDNNTADREILARLAGCGYEQLSQALTRWANESDPFLRRVGDTWLVVSKEDSWLLLSRYLTKDLLGRFEQVAVEVLGQVDPRYELEPDKRHAAQILGKALPHSGHLRSGLAETLALMAARSSTCRFADSASGQDWADRITFQIFKGATKWQHWATLSGSLPSLAEASPRHFMDAVDRIIASSTPVAVEIFQQEEGFMGGAPHSSFLWALELLAWSPEYLGKAAQLLASLTRLDPGGRMANRPGASLREIFLPWHPSTSASLDQRLAVIDQIRGREPVVSWRLLMTMLPTIHSTAHSTYKPVYREWVPSPMPKVTYGEMDRGVDESHARLLSDVQEDLGRWSDLIKALPDLSDSQFNKTVKQLAPVADALTDDGGKEKMQSVLRSLISRHMEFPEAQWAMPPAKISQLRVIYDSLQPTDPIARFAWLFVPAPHVMLPGDDEKDWEKRERAIDDLRKQAAVGIYEETGRTGLVEFSSKVEQPWQLGFAIGSAAILEGEQETFLAETLGNEDPAKRSLAFGYITGRAANDSDWLESLRLTPFVIEGPLERKVDLYLCLPFNQRTWKQIEDEGEDLKQAYWSRTNYFGRRALADEDHQIVAESLAEVGRVADSLHFARVNTREGKAKVAPELLVELLEKLVSLAESPEFELANLSHDIPELLKAVEMSGKVDEARIARLEWVFLPFLEYSSHSPKVLHQALATDPKFFVEVLKWIFKGDGDEGDEATEVNADAAARAHSGYNLLRTWRQVPGIDSDGNLDKDVLFEWVRLARASAKEAEREAIGDQQIGQILAHSPEGADGEWPHEAVRDLIEDVSSEHLEVGISVGRFNSRGVTTRGLTDGGQQEREIAEKYRGYATKIRDRWPRTAMMLTRMAQDYDRHAGYQDQSADLTQDLWR